MAAMNVHLTELIAQIETDTPEATALERITEAQVRAHHLNDIGEHLVGHFVSSAKQAGASWSEIGDALGVSKQAAQQRGMQTFDAFTDWARHAVVLSQESARSNQHNYIGTEHLLLGLLGEERGLGARIVLRHAGSAEAASRAVSAKLGPATTERPPEKIPFTPFAKSALEHSVRAAKDLDHDFVGTEHILLGLLATDGGAREALHELGLDPDAVRTEVRDEVAALPAERDH
ncbi:MAG: Clp protease N-terminal domain-containing protein [Sciscionella sp.]